MPTVAIRMLTAIAGQWAANAGDVVMVPLAEAARLVGAGYAEYVQPEPPPAPATSGRKRRVNHDA